MKIWRDWVDEEASNWFTSDELYNYVYPLSGTK